MAQLKPDTCPHANCRVEANVNRIMVGDTGRTGAMLLHVSVTCDDCGSGFWFPGNGTGTSYVEPTTTTDGFQLSAPIVQANRRNQPDPSLVSVAVRNSDTTKGYRG